MGALRPGYLSTSSSSSSSLNAMWGRGWGIDGSREARGTGGGIVSLSSADYSCCLSLIIHWDFSQGLATASSSSGCEDGGSGIKGVERGNGSDRGGDGGLSLPLDDGVEEGGFVPVERGGARGFHIPHEVPKRLVLVFQVALSGRASSH